MGRGLGLAELGNKDELDQLGLELSQVGWWWGWGKTGNKAKAQLQLGLGLSRAWQK